jgi:hypothetical protein
LSDQRFHDRVSLTLPLSIGNDGKGRALRGDAQLAPRNTIWEFMVVFEYVQHICLPELKYHGLRKWTSCEAQLLKSVAFKNLGAGVDSPGVRNDPHSVLTLREWRSDLTRPDSQVPQAIKLLNDDVHLNLPQSYNRS